MSAPRSLWRSRKLLGGVGLLASVLLTMVVDGALGGVLPEGAWAVVLGVYGAAWTTQIGGEAAADWQALRRERPEP